MWPVLMPAHRRRKPTLSFTLLVARAQVTIEVVSEGQLMPDRLALPCVKKLALLQRILHEEERQVAASPQLVASCNTKHGSLCTQATAQTLPIAAVRARDLQNAAQPSSRLRPPCVFACMFVVGSISCVIDLDCVRVVYVRYTMCALCMSICSCARVCAC